MQNPKRSYRTSDQNPTVNSLIGLPQFAAVQQN